MSVNGKSPHILNTSANLLGFCLVALTSIRISKFNESTSIDEAAGVASILLMASCLLSFWSMRTRHAARTERIEYAAEIVFLAGLLCLSVTIVLVSFNVFFI